MSNIGENRGGLSAEIAARGPSLRPPIVLNRAFQFLGGFLFAVVVPALFGPNISLWVPGAIKSQDNTIVATLLAFLVGFVLFRRIIVYPGVSASLFILPLFSIIYIGVSLTFLFARVDYSRFQLGLSFLLCVAWFYLLYFLFRKAIPYKIALAPQGDIKDLTQLGSINWTTLTEPKLPPGEYSCLVADLRAEFSDDWERFITDCAVSGVPVFHTKQIYESLTGRVEIEHLSENGLGSLLPNIGYFKVKRFLDVVISLLLLPIALPFILIFGLIILCVDGRPVFFTQDRAGYQGKTFRMWKFRTMRQDDTDRDPRDAAITRTQDPRITPLGRIMRKYRIDEAPQIFNIIRGNMSWIGPRPEAIALSKWYEEGLPFYRYRYVVRPGLTGWAQVNQGHVTAIDQVNEKLQYDFFYIKNFSPWLDFLIVLKTVRIVITGYSAK